MDKAMINNDVFGCGTQACAMAKGKDFPLTCSKCKREIAAVNGILVDTSSPIMENHLEEIDYDALHGVSIDNSRAIGAGYIKLLKESAGMDLDADKCVLEVGSGSGLLTLGLLMNGLGKNYVASDVSSEFLAANKANMTSFARSNQPDSQLEEPIFLQCSIDDLPFKAGSLDYIIGNSVLHHIYDYKNALTSMRNCLRDGGSVVMSEPIVQGKVLPALILKLIAEVDLNSATPKLDDMDRQKIANFVTMANKFWWQEQAERVKHTADDKHLFDIAELQATAKELGFSRTFAIDVGVIEQDLKSVVVNSARMLEIDEARLGDFEFILDSVRATLISSMGSNFFCNHALLVFQK